MALRVALLAVLGLVLVAAGFACSPWPWMAAVAPGAVVVAFAVSLLLEEVDE